MTSAPDWSAAAQLKVLVQFATERLRAANVENPRLDAELLLAFAAGVTRARLLTDAIVIDEAFRERYTALVDRRVARMPLAYIVGRREFYSLELQVSPEVLIPRPETETVVAAALEYLAGRQDGLEVLRARRTMTTRALEAASAHRSRIIDLGTGSGAIALAIAANAPHCEIVATDVSAEALALAARNAVRLGLTSQIEFRRADCWEEIDGGPPLGRFDLIVANPPYVRESEIGSLPSEIREFEPRLALSGGPDGLAFYRRIAAGARRYLTPGGALIVEIGQGQATDVAAISCAARLGEIAVLNDLAGIQRVVVAHSSDR